MAVRCVLQQNHPVINHLYNGILAVHLPLMVLAQDLNVAAQLLNLWEQQAQVGKVRYNWEWSVIACCILETAWL